jgi:hypothetical protein
MKDLTVALIIPCCGGKTTLSGRLPLVDFDIGAVQGPAGRLIRDLSNLAMGNLAPWSLTVECQRAFMEQVLKVRRRGVLFLLMHSGALAADLGCNRIYHFAPDVALHEAAIESRGPGIRYIALQNRATIVSEAKTGSYHLHRYSTFGELYDIASRVVLHCVNLGAGAEHVARHEDSQCVDNLAEAPSLNADTLNHRALDRRLSRDHVLRALAGYTSRPATLSGRTPACAAPGEPVLTPQAGARCCLIEGAFEARESAVAGLNVLALQWNKALDVAEDSSHSPGC